jgi:molybdenum cofactor biosynthesis enzyme MoaA
MNMGFDGANLAKAKSNAPVEFLWLELTNTCNLQCSHCYSDSSPTSGANDSLTKSDYLNVIRSAADNGCRSIQFIGGEPTVNRSLPDFIDEAAKVGFTFIEVFSNLVSVPTDTIEAMARHRGIMHVATSVYSHEPDTHDQITGKVGSFFATMRNATRIMDLGLPLRAAFVEMEANTGHAEQTIAFLKERGIERISFDKIRNFGRGEHSDEIGMEGLCGQCAGTTLCVGPDGVVSPCIMSRKWAVGNLHDSDLGSIMNGSVLQARRREIGSAIAEKNNPSAPHDEDNVVDISMCNPCAPYAQCGPCPPNTNCPPHNCNPWYGR